MGDLADDYVKKLVTKWPPIMVDDSLSNPDNMATTYRKGGFDEFDTRQHPISLNAQVIWPWLQATTTMFQ